MIHGSTLKYRKERIFQVSFWAHIVHLFPTSESNGIWSAVFRSWKEKTARIPHSKHRICKKKDKTSKQWEVLQVSSYSYKKILYQSILSISDILPPQTKRGSQPENKPKQKKENPIHHPSESLVGSINCIMHCYQLNILKTTSGWETMQWFSWGDLFLFWGKLCGLHFSIKHIGNRLSVGLSCIYIYIDMEVYIIIYWYMEMDCVDLCWFVKILCFARWHFLRYQNSGYQTHHTCGCSHVFTPNTSQHALQEKFRQNFQDCSYEFGITIPKTLQENKVIWCILYIYI